MFVLSYPDLPPPLGATPDPTGTTFAVFASQADRVELCLDDAGTERRIQVENRIHGVWFTHVPGVKPGQRYAYRVYGPWAPEHGLRHNGCKLLLDPYARAIDGDLQWNPAIFGHRVGPDFGGPTDVKDDRDSAPYMPRSVVIDDSFDWEGDTHCRIPWTETVVYETHVKGATQLHPGVPHHLRGTYAGLAHPAFLTHLERIGVTTIELLPVHAFTSEQHLHSTNLSNYWGYNTLGFFAPHLPYASTDDPNGAVREFKGMVKLLHRRGFEVILDVVYNHTAEQSYGGPTLSWRGLDNTTYYRLDERGNDIDVTGCGNTLDLREPMVCRMVLDSLRYWVNEFHVDGFRFDLAVALARGVDEGYDPNHPFLVALRTDPVLSRVKLIAEPWDVGIHGWRTGQFPPPFSEWNDRFRDAVRTFWLADAAAPPDHGHGVRELATRLAGSQDLFGHSDRGPLASINFAAAHDGFTLADSVSYEQKHNLANGEGNRDGHGDNRSYNHGAEGPTDNDAILVARRRSVRNILGTTLLATGAPMLCAGDEMGRTQGGNNNAYCQDNDISWLDWTLEDWQNDLLDTTAALIKLRQSHRVFRQSTFFTSLPRPGDGRADVLWYDVEGQPMTNARWEDPSTRVLQMLLLGDALEAQSFLLQLQGDRTPQQVTLPPHQPGLQGYTLVWSSVWERPQPAGELLSAQETITVPERTLNVYHLR